MNNVFLLLGSNLGDRKEYLQQAIMHISYDISPDIRISSVYETESWGKTDEPDYLNMVVEVKTSLAAQAVLERILNIEKVMGRVREEKSGCGDPLMSSTPSRTTTSVAVATAPFCQKPLVEKSRLTTEGGRVSSRR